MVIRDATEADLASIAAIYGHYVLTSVATFDTTPPHLDAWRTRLGTGRPGDHLLVAEHEGVVVGHASSTAYRTRPAYGRTREVSAYVDPGWLGHGTGRRLYEGLLDRLRRDDMHTALAAVALPNDASRALHTACGFEPVGVMREVGHKLERWVDVEWWQLVLR